MPIVFVYMPGGVTARGCTCLGGQTAQGGDACPWGCNEDYEEYFYLRH